LKEGATQTESLLESTGRRGKNQEKKEPARWKPQFKLSLRFIGFWWLIPIAWNPKKGRRGMAKLPSDCSNPLCEKRGRSRPTNRPYGG